MVRCLALLIAVAGCSAKPAANGPVDRPTFSGDVDGDAFVLADGVVVQPRLDALYFPEQRGRMLAVELATGGSLWTSTEGIKPLFVRDGKLLAQQRAARDGRALGVVALDTERRGSLALEIQPIPLPDGVFPTLAGAFRVRAGANDGDVYLAWSAGDPVTASAAVIIDLATGGVSGAPDDALAGVDIPTAPPANATGGAYEISSGDRRHLMRVERSPGGTAYVWSISSLDTGEKVAQLSVAEPAHAFYVHGPLVIAPTATHVRALSLDGGNEVWRWAMMRPAAP